MEAIKTIFGAFGGGIKFFFWFMSTVVIPLTFWFAVLQSKVDGASADIVKISVKIREDERAAKENFRRLHEKLDNIKEDLGVVKGELRRIK